VEAAVPPLSLDLYILTVIAAASTILGAVLAWPIWLALVRAFVPTRSANALLDWQRSLSAPTTPGRNGTRGLDAANPA
jgi:hypothetical protein